MDLFAAELVVSDWPAALAWYRDRLGLSVLLTDEPNRYALLSAGSCRLALKAGAPAAGSTKLVFHVDDLDAALARLAGRGVLPVGPVRESAEGYRAVTLADPDGHRLDVFAWVGGKR